MLNVHSDCSDCFAGGKQRIKEIRATSRAIRVWIKRQCIRYNIATPFRDHFLPGRVLVVTHLACCLYIFFLPYIVSCGSFLLSGEQSQISFSVNFSLRWHAPHLSRRTQRPIVIKPSRGQTVVIFIVMTGSALVELVVSWQQIADIRTPRTIINKKTFKQKVKVTQVKSSVESFSRLKLAILIVTRLLHSWLSQSSDS